AFFIPYLIMLLLVGIPIFFLELNLGQFSSSGPATCWRFAPIFSGIGVGMVIVSALVAIYYNMIIGWALYYLFASFTDDLPWTRCQGSWASDYCRDYLLDYNGLRSNCTDMGWDWDMDGACYNMSATPKKIRAIWNKTLAADNNIKRILPTEEYLRNEVLGIGNPGAGLENLGPIHWQLVLCYLLGWIFVGLTLSKGVKSSGKRRVTGVIRGQRSCVGGDCDHICDGRVSQNSQVQGLCCHVMCIISSCSASPLPLTGGLTCGSHGLLCWRLECSYHRYVRVLGYQSRLRCTSVPDGHPNHDWRQSLRFYPWPVVKWWWAACWMFITPVLVGFVAVFSWIDYQRVDKLPKWADALGWLMTLSVILAIIVTAIVKVVMAGGNIRQVLRPTPDWGPALPRHRQLCTKYVPNFVVDPNNTDTAQADGLPYQLRADDGYEILKTNGHGWYQNPQPKPIALPLSARIPNSNKGDEAYSTPYDPPPQFDSHRL
ncbi:hypothetical protein BaRGS_00012738, partial [Batillaria attramentaria]